MSPRERFASSSGRDEEKRAPAERLYRSLLRIYPSEFREVFAEMMIDFYRERMTRGTTRLQKLSRVWIGFRLFADAAFHGVLERLAPLRPRDGSDRSSATNNGEGNMLSSLRQDLVYAFRNLRRAPAFTATVLLTLALGIGANVAIFSVVNAVLLRPLPFADPNRIIQLSNADAGSTLSEPEVADLQRDARSFSQVGRSRSPMAM